ncbi:hypothetical protein HPP92_007740 [Vanilla planifolia]|uniref:Uncharacterized protein n=1 Tax=Vanilla planifolia TaxID=51239 RepID=A0A835RD65_VANPL|nr:hypothetical protein HPP92_007740 [Vanilla planifolia]
MLQIDLCLDAYKRSFIRVTQGETRRKGRERASSWKGFSPERLLPSSPTSDLLLWFDYSPLLFQPNRKETRRDRDDGRWTLTRIRYERPIRSH